MTYSNVGGFGIDGDISSLIGASLANPQKLYYCILGDLAFFYDMNVLGNHHIRNNIRILLINNGRGTEFRNYRHQGSVFGEDADKYIAAAGHFGNKSPELVKHYAQNLGFQYLSANNKEEFNNNINIFIAPYTNKKEDKPIILEVFTNSDDESDALKKILNIVSDPKYLIKHSIKSVTEKVLGKEATDKLKKII